MDSYLKMASKINMGSMSHTSLVSYVKIWESNNQADPIEVPLEKDGTLLLSTLIGQYPNTAGLRFWSDTGAWRGLKCENNVIYPPPQGWGTLDYYIVTAPPGLKRSSMEGDGPTSNSQKTGEEMAVEEPDEEEVEEESETEEAEEDDEVEELMEEPIEIKKEPEEEKVPEVPEFIIQALPFTMKEKELKEHLTQFGELESCQIMKNRQGESRGYAFLRYKTNEGAKKAREGIHIFNGRRYYLLLANKSKVAMGQKMHMYSSTRIKLFVGHLPAGCDESHLRNYFSKYGVLKDVYIPQPNKGYGFIEFGSQEVADKVLEDTHILMDTFLNVNYPATMKQNDVKRMAEKMAKEQGNGRPGILGYYGVGPMGMPNDMLGNNFNNGPNNYRDPYRDPRNNFNFNNNIYFNNNFDNRNNSGNRNNFNNRDRGNFRGRGKGGLPRAPWATN